jgi:hypothetical protein
MNYTASNDDNPSNGLTSSGSSQPYDPLMRYLISGHQALTYCRSGHEPLDVDAMLEQVEKNLAEIHTTESTRQLLEATKSTGQLLEATEGLPVHAAIVLKKDLDEIKSALHRLDASRAILVQICEEALSVLKDVKATMARLDSTRDATLIKRLEEDLPEAVRALLALTNTDCK